MRLFRSAWPVLGTLSLALALASGCQRDTPLAPLTPATPLEEASATVAARTPVPLNQPLPPEVDPEEDKGQLRTYFHKKYSDSEYAAVRATVAEIMPGYTPAEQRQAVTEILSFSYVIFHETQYHHLDRNHAALRKHEKTLQKFCQMYDVPAGPVTAIVSWENSGGSTKVSFADAAGLGQMTDGAIQSAHDFARQEANRIRSVSTDAAKGEQLARGLENIEARHRHQAHVENLPDERFSPSCNLEDVVLFYKYLSTQYGGRHDLAIGAYHRGVANTDDIVYDYLTHDGNDKTVVYPTSDRSDFLSALERDQITYVTLWNNPRSRQMLNGLRTMDGEVTTDANRDQALQDESDIYPWKVLGSLTAYRQGTSWTAGQIARYSTPQSEAEASGLPAYESLRAVREALEAGRLVHARSPVTGSFSADLQEDARRASDAVTPELDGYLFSLVTRWRKVAGDNTLQLPVKTLFNARALESGNYGLFSKVQMRGITAVLLPASLPRPAEVALKKVLEVDFLNDRIYRSTLDSGDVLICLNPRFGHQFLAAYQKYVNHR